MKYKHYSFDLWMTLIRSHPQFKKERTKFFYDNFNRKDKTIEEVELIFRQIDVMCNAINEKTGRNIDAEEMYLMVISAMNDYVYPLQEVNIRELYQEMQQLVFKYLPVVYSPDTPKVLKNLHEQATGSSFSLLCNTAFIKGSTLRTVLNRIGLDSYFNFQLYSDEAGMSKPNKNLFILMIDMIAEIRHGDITSLKEIVHIGDNKKADICGADSAGISSILINSNSQTILNLLPL